METAGPERPLSGRAVVVTGATSGIGLATARELAARGARTVLIGRGEDRVRALAEGLAEETRNPSVTSIGVTDLSARREWFRVAGLLRDRHPVLHVLVNNAGAIYGSRSENEDGLERTFALNVLAPFALTALLADRLLGSAPARVVNVSSAAHRGTHVPWADLESKAAYRPFTAYGRSKLELILLTREIAARWRGTGVTVNAVHPGFVRSGFAHGTPGLTPALTRSLATLVGRDPARGSAGPVRLAADPALEGVTGLYFSGDRTVPGSRASRDMESARRLFEVVVGYVRLPGVDTAWPRHVPGAERAGAYPALSA